MGALLPGEDVGPPIRESYWVHREGEDRVRAWSPSEAVRLARSATHGRITSYRYMCTIAIFDHGRRVDLRQRHSLAFAHGRTWGATSGDTSGSVMARAYARELPLQTTYSARRQAEEDFLAGFREGRSAGKTTFTIL